MNADDREDRVLKAAFDALGRSGRASGPSFDQLASQDVLDRARSRRRRRQAAFLVGVLVIPSVFILRPRGSNEPDFTRFRALTGIDPAAVTWRAPSDVLLGVPGHDLLRRVPLIDIQAHQIPDHVRPTDSNASKRRSSS